MKVHITQHFAFSLQAGMTYSPKGTFGHVYKRLEEKLSLSDDILHNVWTFKTNMVYVNRLLQIVSARHEKVHYFVLTVEFLAQFFGNREQRAVHLAGHMGCNKS